MLGNSSWDFFGGKFLVQGFFGGGGRLTFAHIRSSSSLEIRTPTTPWAGTVIVFFVLGLSFIYFFCLFVGQCHPVVANRLHSRFQSWLSDWVKSNVTGDQEGRCRDWLLGKVDGLHPCTTTCEVVTSAAIEHNKYSVKWDKDKKDKQEVAQNDSKESEQKAAS